MSAVPPPGKSSVEDACEACPECEGNGVGRDGYGCWDCEGTGCARHPFCDADHEEEDEAYASA